MRPLADQVRPCTTPVNVMSTGEDWIPHCNTWVCCLQTPEVSRVRSGPSWVADLDSYLSSHEGTPNSSTDARHELVACVKANPQSAEAWRSWLAYEEAHCGNITHSWQAAADPGKVSLYHMYYWATTLVPRSSSKSHKEAYLKLWLGFARQQWWVMAQSSRTAAHHRCCSTSHTMQGCQRSVLHPAASTAWSFNIAARPGAIVRSYLTISMHQLALSLLQGTQPRRCPGHVQDAQKPAHWGCKRSPVL